MPASNKLEPAGDCDHCSQVQAKLQCPERLSTKTTHRGKGALTGLSTKLDDDILSIMCDDNEEEDLLEVGGDGPSEKSFCQVNGPIPVFGKEWWLKLLNVTILTFGCWSLLHHREWSFESRFGSKRKQDPLVDTSQPVNMKRSRSIYKMPLHSNGRSQGSSAHNRLGRHGSFQHNQECQKPCFKFIQNGKCHRDSCQFLHSNRTRDNDMVHNWRSRTGLQNYDSNITGFQAHQMINLQQKVQEQQMQLKQQKGQLQSLTQHLLEMELGANHAADQAKQVQESLHHVQQQQEQLNHTNKMFEQLSRAHCKMGEHVRILEGQVQRLEANEYSQLDILAHYQFIADFQRHQLHHFKRDQSTTSAENGGTLPFPQLPDLRHLPPLKKPVVYSPRPRSADSNYPQPRSAESHYPGRLDSLSHSVSSSRHSGEGEGGQTGLCQASGFHGPSMMRDAQSLVEKTFYHAPSNPRVVRILPVRQRCPDPHLFVDYQHEIPAVRLQ